MASGSLSAHADPSRVRGTVRDAETGAPVEGATVFGADDTSTTTGADGTFVLPGPQASVTVIDGGHATAAVVVLEGDALEILLEPADGEVIEVQGEKQERTPGAVTLSRAKLTVIPGSRGDVLSGVKNLPGVANNGSLTPFSAGLIIRGSSPQDSRILIDGFEIPVLYHFLGVQSVVPTEMLGDLSYQPGNFGVAYGRATGGIVAVTSRDEAATKPGGFAELSFINVAGLVQGPIGKRASYTVAARRSVIDAVLAGVLPSDSGLSFTAYPVYYDYQAKVAYRPTDHWTLSALVLGSDDRVELFTDGDNAMDPVATGRVTNATSFVRGITSARYRRGHLELVAAASAYTDTNHFTVGEDRYLLLDRDGIAARSELTWDASKKLRLVVGGEADITRTQFDIKFTRPPREGDPRGPNFTQDALLETTGENTFRDVAGWATATAYPHPTLEVSAGARVDVYLRNDAAVIQPRAQVLWQVANGSTLRAAAGLYSRPPEHLDQGLQPELSPERSRQLSLGAERRLTDTLTASATVFDNRLTELLVLPVDRQDPAALGGYENLGSGEARGLELLLKLQRADVFGWLAYTGSITTRRDDDMSPDRRFDYDQMHNLIAVASWQVSPRWRLGGRFQLTSGRPYTPIIGSSYQADVDLYRPIYGAASSQRVELQHQLDLRVDRVWTFDRWQLSAYLDISNVYINGAAIDYQYNFDYSRRTAVTSLPILPSFGVRGTL